MKPSITFFMHNIYAMGGTVKSVSELANVLVDQGHDVTIISVFKINQSPYFDLDARIRIVPLVDYNLTLRNIPALIMNRVHRKTPFLKPKHITPYEPGIQQFSSWIEKKMIRAIQNVDTDLLIGTRAAFNLLIANYTPQHVKTIGMEHVNFEYYPEGLQHEIQETYPKLDMLTTLTTQDQATYQTKLDIPIVILPNIINETPLTHITKQRQIIAAGRLEYEKGFDLLLAAVSIAQEILRRQQYAVVIYGEGAEGEALHAQIQHAGISDIVTIHPTTPHLPEKLAESQITVIPSRSEGFGMVILEAMNQSNIVVAFGDNHGPEALIDHETNGYLVEYGNPDALAQQLIALITHRDDATWSRMIAAGHETVTHYSPEHIYALAQKTLLT